MKRIQKPRKGGRVPQPPPTEILRDRRKRRPAEELRREIDREIGNIDDVLKERYE
jgi:hypothetical protein